MIALWPRGLLTGGLIGIIILALWIGHTRYRTEQSAGLIPEIGAEGRGESGRDGEPETDQAKPAGGMPAPTVAADVWVHVAGAVHRPGLHRVPEGSRVAEVIEIAGGALPAGVPGSLNLAGLVSDGEKVFVPTQNDLDRLTAGSPVPAAAGARHGPLGGADSPGQRGAVSGVGADADAAPININRADAGALQKVPGIGPILAERILLERTRRGQFNHIDDLLAVSGIGTKTLQRIRTYLTI